MPFRNIATVCATAIALAAYLAPADAKQTMSLAERTIDGIAIVEIECEQNGEMQACSIAGTHIFRSSTKPLGASGDPRKVCYVEVGVSNVAARASPSAANLYVSAEGPGGMCSTQIVSTIDFSMKIYTFTRSSADHTGDVCGQIANETHTYTNAAFVAPANELRCEGVEAIPSLWFP
jgi:hypothetical protein